VPTLPVRNSTTWRERMDACAGGASSDASLVPARLHEAMRYSVLGGASAYGPHCCSPRRAPWVWRKTRWEAAACAIELVHVYSPGTRWIYRRWITTICAADGRPATNAYDEATALLVGDALQPLAFSIAGRRPKCALPPPPRPSPLALHVFALDRHAGAGHRTHLRIGGGPGDRFWPPRACGLDIGAGWKTCMLRRPGS